jgi:hypothetical protein
MSSQDDESLRDLDGVRVFVDELPAEALARRLSREQIQHAVEARLRAAGITILTTGHFPVGDPFLRVRVGVSVEHRGWVGYQVAVDFVQLVFLRRNPQVVHNRAQTWKASERLDLVPVAQLAKSLERDLIGQIDEYIAAHRRVNPPR